MEWFRADAQKYDKIKLYDPYSLEQNSEIKEMTRTDEICLLMRH